jgi:adenylosuccinate synthase
VNTHLIVVDLGYGDAGKGTIVDWLCRAGQPGGARDGASPVAVVRFNGGAQAAHHVLAPSGQVHAFAQFGSGTFAGTPTFLSRFMLVDPLALTAEAEHLRRLGVPDPLALLTVDREALLTTPYHQAANQAREEARGSGRHGSCGMGIGETARYALEYPLDAPRAGDLTAPALLRRKLTLLRDRLVGSVPAGSVPAGSAGAGRSAAPPPRDVADVFRAVAARLTLAGEGDLTRLLRRGPAVFEGAQGVLLDEWRGFHPYTTWSTTTFANAETLLAEAGLAGPAATRLGVTRTYQTRHGPGPFPTEDPALPVTEPHNGDGRWQGPFRAGHLDAVALGYACAVTGGVDAVALTHLDTARRAGQRLRVGRGYRIGGRTVTRLEPGPPRDLDYQRLLTETLLTARPVYDAGDGPAPKDWPDVVSEIAHAPVAVCSYGPATGDKVLLNQVGARPLDALSR